MPFLVLSRRGESITTLTLDGDAFSIGREPDNNLQLNDPQISRQHCVLRRSDEGYELVDSSRNGTFLEGERVGAPTPLHDGERIELAMFTLTYHDGAPPCSTETQDNQHKPTLILKYEPQTKSISVERIELEVDRPQGKTTVVCEHLPITFGAAGHNSIPITHDPYVSRMHCQIESTPHGLVLRDLESRNGTWWQGQRVSTHTLPERGEFLVGKTAVRYHVRIEKEPLTPTAKHRCGELFGTSRAMQEIFALIDRVAPSDATVLISGESGTGKELLARALHASSGRAPRQFTAINCGAIPATIIESELFGHERGAFTGATNQHRGVFEQASGGTLFLDEIGEMSLDLQTRLLRVLETRTVRRVGGTQEIPVDVRIIAATHRNLAQSVQSGAFREDLFYRLYVVPIDIPPLRERIEDIAMLADHFLQVLRSPGRSYTWTAAAKRKLLQHSWPGNVRELKNTIERALLHAPEDTIDEQIIQFAPIAGNAASAITTVATPSEDALYLPGKGLRHHERQVIEHAIRTSHGNVTRAAKTLGIARSTLWAKVREFAVDVSVYRPQIPTLREEL